MLTEEEKQSLINQRLKEYEIKIYQLEIDKTALLAIGNEEGAKNIDLIIEGVKKSYEAVKGMI